MGLIISRVFLAIWSFASSSFNQSNRPQNETPRSGETDHIEVVVGHHDGASLSRFPSDASTWHADKDHFLRNSEMRRTRSQTRNQKGRKYTRNGAQCAISPPTICVQDWSSVPFKMSEMYGSPSRRRKAPLSSATSHLEKSPPLAAAMLHPNATSQDRRQTQRHYRSQVPRVDADPRIDHREVVRNADAEIQAKSATQHATRSPDRFHSTSKPKSNNSNANLGRSPVNLPAEPQPSHQSTVIEGKPNVDPNPQIPLHISHSDPMPSSLLSHPPRPTSICFALTTSPYIPNALSAISGSLFDPPISSCVLGPTNSVPLPLFTNVSNQPDKSNRNAALWMLDFECLPTADHFDLTDEFPPHTSTPYRFSMQYSDIFDFDMYGSYMGSCDDLAAVVSYAPSEVGISLGMALLPESGSTNVESGESTSFGDQRESVSKRNARLFGNTTTNTESPSPSCVEGKDVYRNAAYSRPVGAKKTGLTTLGQGSPENDSIPKAVLRSAVRRKPEKVLAAATSSGSMGSVKEAASQDSINVGIGSQDSTQLDGFNSSVDSTIADRLQNACRDMNEWHWTEEELLKVLKPGRL
ncbi:hypothetical protein Moror_12322 [Moniliophthora roreri MCA 2997]|uniref:Uncharacterized protein n=2 Tax=Moniliophthora roreri TaxID=221103 RepID=V2YW40_MONRO|nr:hypothetical protein Moror_12322 [Moniliophthora roreri MCA 2997]